MICQEHSRISGEYKRRKCFDTMRVLAEVQSSEKLCFIANVNTVGVPVYIGHASFAVSVELCRVRIILDRGMLCFHEETQAPRSFIATVDTESDFGFCVMCWNDVICNSWNENQALI